MLNKMEVTSPRQRVQVNGWRRILRYFLPWACPVPRNRCQSIAGRSTTDLPCPFGTSTCRSFVTISSQLCLFLGISSVLHRLESHTSGRTTTQGGRPVATPASGSRQRLPERPERRALLPGRIGAVSRLSAIGADPCVTGHSSTILPAARMSLYKAALVSVLRRRGRARALGRGGRTARRRAPSPPLTL